MTAAAPPRSSPLHGTPSRRRTEGAIRIVLLVAASLSVAISVGIIGSLIFEAAAFVTAIELGQLVEVGWFPRRGLFDLATVLAGSLIVSAIAMALAAPVGLASAVYLSEYAKPRTRKVIKPILEILAGVPSVVLGFFALTVISPTLIDPVCPGATPLFNLAAAGIGVGILITPLIASIAEDAMHAVPNSLREASYGLGARKWATSVFVVVPAAVSGIVASLIIGLSRGIGETMVVAIAAGAVGGSLFSLNPCQPGQTMTAAMTALATGSDQVRGASLAFPSLFFIGLLLFGMTLVLNIVSERFVRRVRQRY